MCLISRLRAIGSSDAVPSERPLSDNDGALNRELGRRRPRSSAPSAARSCAGADVASRRSGIR